MFVPYYKEQLLENVLTVKLKKEELWWYQMKAQQRGGE